MTGIETIALPPAIGTTIITDGIIDADDWAIILGVFGFIMPGINNWAHAGGFAGGWIAGQLMGLSDEHRESAGVIILALSLIALTFIGIGLSFVSVTGALLG